MVALLGRHQQRMPANPRVNWNHPLASGLVELIAPTPRTGLVGLIRGTVFVPTGDAILMEDRYRSPNSGTSTGARCAATPTDLKLAVPLSWGWVGMFHSDGTLVDGPFIFGATYASDGSGGALSWDFQRTTKDKVFFGANRAGSFNPIGGGPDYDAGLSSNYGRVQTGLGCISNGAQAGYWNGQALVTSAISWTGPTYGATTDILVNRGIAQTGDTCDTSFFMGLLWNRYLSSDEAVLFAQDPFSLVEEAGLPQRFWVLGGSEDANVSPASLQAVCSFASTTATATGGAVASVEAAVATVGNATAKTSENVAATVLAAVATVGNASVTTVADATASPASLAVVATVSNASGQIQQKFVRNIRQPRPRSVRRAAYW